MTLVDPKTSQNTAIAISRFKMTPELICECLKVTLTLTLTLTITQHPTP